jgi:recombination protein RecA
MYGPKKKTPGGSGITFQSSVRVELSRRGNIEVAKDVISGVNVEAEVVKNKVAPPFKKVEFKVSFDNGVNRLSGLVGVLVKEGLIIEDKGWYTYQDKKYREKEIEEIAEQIISEKNK